MGDGEKKKNGKWEVHYRNTWKPVKFTTGNKMFSKCTPGKTTQATLQSTTNISNLSQITHPHIRMSKVYRYAGEGCKKHAETFFVYLYTQTKIKPDKSMAN